MATVEFENALRIERAVEEVFRFAANPENLPMWNYYVLEVRRTSPGELGVGSTFLQRRKTDRQQLRIAAYEEGRRVVLETVPPSEPQVVREMSFEAEGDGSRIVDRWELEVRGAAATRRRKSPARWRRTSGRSRSYWRRAPSGCRTGEAFRIELGKPS